jgi:hypothetical protein
MKRMALALGLALASIAIAGCGGDDGGTGSDGDVKSVPINGNIVVPASWAGSWDITITLRDCTSNAILSVEEITTQICPGDTLMNPFVPVFENCTGTVSTNQLSVDCNFQGGAGPCQVTVGVSMTVNRSGNALSGNGRVDSAATPACGSFFTAGCQLFTIAGTRTSTSTAGCDSLAVQRRAFLR